MRYAISMNLLFLITGTIIKVNVEFLKMKNNHNYVFDNLLIGFRWDSPLITIQLSDELPGEQIFKALFNRQPLPPNQSTQNVPLCSSRYLSDLDKVTKDVINVRLLLLLWKNSVC